MSAATNSSSQIEGAPNIDFSKFETTRSHNAARQRKDRVMTVLIALAFVVALIPLISVLLTTIAGGIKRLNFDFLSHNMQGVFGGKPTPSGGYGGVLHAIIGTLEITGGAMIISIPIGLMCSVYLVEYARGGRLAHTVSLLVDVMSGIPSIVAGLFAYSLFTILGGPGTINGFEGSVALSLLMIPTVVKTSEEMLKIVPNDLREASYALGVTKQRTITKVVLRTALPGIVSGAILAIARVIGETAPLLMTAGFILNTNVNLFNGPMATLPVYVFKEFSDQTVTCPAAAGAGCVEDIPTERAWAAALVLIIIVLVLNLIGRLIEKMFAVKTER
ncbi:phosphate ABC transporter substrate-binding protein [Bifidobacterium sp. DSM 109958]|uniref:Phosphate transport system permease protein PstA n=1 Tax=Bifidobacterium moraviense TaxID=2675323 RepID=A0A7Y0HXR0_9BIFI|nr:phosphate ABC transporter permease PstA [Bifidobacterium sp. DSM 109958]NMN00486.1 phosphate ABC transporter substrate-binding protein [Bifidobacterium sp. DSM 109958]